MSEARQCPYCELRFIAEWELKAHLAEDHEREPGDGGGPPPTEREDPWER